MSNLEPVDAGLPIHEQSVAEGEIVLLGPGGGLAVQVMAVRGERAWVRDLNLGRDGVVDLWRVRRFGVDAGVLQ
jgi:hypothetical protein